MRFGKTSEQTIITSHHLASLARAELESIRQLPEYEQMVSTVGAGSVVRMTDIVTRPEILQSALYQKLLRPLDGGLAVMGLHFDGAELVMTAICRSAARDRDFDEATMAVIRACQPHLLAVAGISRKLQQEVSDLRGALDALDSVTDGILLLRANGALMKVNAAAHFMLERRDRVGRSKDGVVAIDRSEDSRLQQAISRVSKSDYHEDASATGSPTQIAIRGGRAGWPLIATVMSAKPIADELSERSVLIHLADSSKAVCLPRETLRRELGLTSREASLTQHLAGGATLSEVASDLDISTGTARQYLKSIFDKLDVHSQADLLRIVRR